MSVRKGRSERSRTKRSACSPRRTVTIAHRRTGARGWTMALELWWGSGSPYSWRALLALEYKQLPYVSHLVQFAKQEHKSPQMLKMNPRGRVPVLKDGDMSVSSRWRSSTTSTASIPKPPLFGRTPEEAGTIARVICEYQSYAEDHIKKKSSTRSCFRASRAAWRRSSARYRDRRRRARSRSGWRRRRGWSARASPRPTSWCFRASRCCCVLSSAARRRICARACCRSRRNFPAIAAWIGRIEGAARLRAHLSAALEGVTTRPRGSQ